MDESARPVAASLGFRPLPETYERPIASPQTIVPGQLGSIRQPLDVTNEADIPERLLRMANEIMVQNFRLSPWIHAGGEVRHHYLAPCSQEIMVTVLIQQYSVRNGLHF